jgi:hypothetical protein
MVQFSAFQVTPKLDVFGNTFLRLLDQAQYCGFW